MGYEQGNERKKNQVNPYEPMYMITSNEIQKNEILAEQAYPSSEWELKQTEKRMKDNVMGKYELKIDNARTWESSSLAEMNGKTHELIFILASLSCSPRDSLSEYLKKKTAMNPHPLAKTCLWSSQNLLQISVQTIMKNLFLTFNLLPSNLQCLYSSLRFFLS